MQRLDLVGKHLFQRLRTRTPTQSGVCRVCDSIRFNGAFSRPFTTWSMDPYVVALAKSGNQEKLESALKRIGVPSNELVDTTSLLLDQHGGMCV